MNCKRINITILACFCLASAAYAQKSETGNWLIYFGNQKVSSKWNWHNEVQYRNYNFIGDVNQLLIRTGLGYDLTENNNNILLGYGFIRSHNYINANDKNSFDEHRIFQQFITKQNIEGFFVQHRYRLEERFFADDFKVRFRYFLSLAKPLNMKVMKKNALYLSAYNEIFLNANSPVFDRNRIYGGIGYHISDALKVETGYMTQLQENKSPSQFQLIFFNNLPLTKQN